MLNFLSDSNWLAPQVDFLLYLQGLREQQYGYLLNNFFLSITSFAEFWVPTVLCSIIYWCIDSKKGLYMFTVCGFSVVFSHLLKLIACVYRPWILSDKIKPVDDALSFAKSYSFPSGHSANSSSVYGSLAFIYKKNYLLVLFLILLILAIGFSRLWLGVHTPQDVISGFATGVMFVFVVNYIINWAEENKNRYLFLLVIFDLLLIYSIIFIRYFNIYPMDYVNGKLLVNPDNAVYVTIVLLGYIAGLINGAFLSRRFFPFDASKGSIKSKIFRCILGILTVFLLMHYIFEYFFMNNCSLMLVLPIVFIIGLYPSAFYPYLFSKFYK